MLAEGSDKHLFLLLILENYQVSVAVSCSFFPSPGWWCLVLKLQRYVGAEQQRASYKEFLCCCGGFCCGISYLNTCPLPGSPYAQELCNSRRSNPQLACVCLFCLLPASLLLSLPLGTRRYRAWTGSFLVLDQIESECLASLSWCR